ncbi:GAF domain-containing protein [Sharpea azabuensis]|uniref:GAF domain-containing protein n=2 Tax=Sharpea azabuensis TaxID=322505 RepID=A0A1H6WXB0_9FIRM|nr:GAF domain-containing protein [Sharpea azabuensis]HAJ15327.1 GAF domain-containing protein [Erysipelotrichaceae bacterium]MDD6512109.1 GAF domain-containing protein [Sharpea azabuensis]SEJ18937.1 GAF domain-containing protein [Sharpea azabuensis]SFE02339.1 GAF domain-containing protein [Sharpea azabuensis]SFK95841.1 GAF domain-containing protein [Sharpea azabuensis]
MENLELEQLRALLETERNPIANLANASSFLYNTMNQLNWLGFYLIDGDELILGPFQGKVACTRIRVGQGVCGNAVKLEKTMKIDDVHQFAGHIACDSASNSEVVVPLWKDNQIVGVLDVDSPYQARFSNQDVQFLEKAAKIIQEAI